ncbi:MAG: hypothetical protein KF724_10145 [Phycisphaeraceae bacterium]|nr:hypothetical protein [Phycisphaeraceae bacterium]
MRLKSRSSLKSPSRYRPSGDALLAEAAVERLLLRHGCDLEREVIQPSGHTTDFLVRRDGSAFHLHVKWLSAPMQAPRLGPIPRVLRELGEIERPITVALRWRPGAGCTAFRRMVREVTPFLRAARLGDERVARDAKGAIIGSVRVIAPGPRGSRVALTDARVIDHLMAQSIRVERLLRKALVQFMPRAVNVILIASADAADAQAIDLALHGSLEERWDLFPMRGDRIAHGRSDDGFWAPGRSNGSRAVAWLRAGDSPSTRSEPTRRSRRESKLWLRGGSPLSAPTEALLRELFDH